MAEWIEYNGSDEQIEKIKNAPNGVLFANEYGQTSGLTKYCYHGFVIGSKAELIPGSGNIKEYLAHEKTISFLICEPHPHAKMIKQHADTGEPVYIKYWEYVDGGRQARQVMMKTPSPDWNIPGAKYFFEQFEE